MYSILTDLKQYVVQYFTRLVINDHFITHMTAIKCIIQKLCLKWGFCELCKNTEINITE